MNLRPLPPQAIKIVEVKAFYVASSYEMPERDTRAVGHFSRRIDKRFGVRRRQRSNFISAELNGAKLEETNFAGIAASRYVCTSFISRLSQLVLRRRQKRLQEEEPLFVCYDTFRILFMVINHTFIIATVNQYTTCMISYF